MAISPENMQRLRLEFLKVYNPSLSMMEVKKLYTIKYSSLNLPGCGPCQIKYTFTQFRSDAEDMSEDQIQNILNPNSQTMPVKKTAKKVATKKSDKAVVKAKKTVVKPTVKTKPEVKAKPVIVKAKLKKEDFVAPKVITPEVFVSKPKTNVTQTLPGGIKFLYVPKRK